MIVSACPGLAAVSDMLGNNPRSARRTRGPRHLAKKNWVRACEACEGIPASAHSRESRKPVSFGKFLDLGLRRHFAKGLGSRFRGNERTWLCLTGSTAPLGRRP